MKPSLRHLKVFGSRVCVAKPGKRYAKLDRGDYRGIFLGYTATDANVIYLDLDTGVVKSSPSATFDEAWYSQSQRPPAAQFLYSLGLKDELPEVTLSPPPSTDAYPPKPNLKLPPPKLLSDAIHVPILHHPTPLARIEIAAAAKTTRPAARWDNVLDATTSPLSSIQSILADYEISRNDLAMVYMSPDPYHTAFTESLDTCHLDVAQHPTGGTELRHEADRLILTGTQPGSPAAKLPRWRSRLKHAWLIRVNDQDVHTPDDVSQALLIAQTKGIQTTSLLFAHSEIKHGLTNDGLPQCNVDQLNNRLLRRPSNQDLFGPNQAFHDLWTIHKRRPPIPPGYIIPVERAMQGHPECPLLWENIKDVLQFRPTTQEPCLYVGEIDVFVYSSYGRLTISVLHVRTLGLQI